MLGPVSLRQIGVRRLALQQVRGLSTTPRKVIAYQMQRVTGRIAAWRSPASGEVSA